MTSRYRKLRASTTNILVDRSTIPVDRFHYITYTTKPDQTGKDPVNFTVPTQIKHYDSAWVAEFDAR